MELATRALFVALVVVVAITAVGTSVFLLSIRPHRYTTASTPATAFGWSYEDITLRTTDNVLLAAWFIPKKNEAASRTAVIVLHGYPYSKGNVLGLTPYLHEDYDLLLPDFRYFGDSEGSFTTLGHREWRDVAAAVAFLKDRGYTSVGVWGFSLGASVALLTLPHVGGIDAVVADSAYSDLHEMTLDYYGRLPVLAGSLARVTDLLTIVCFGFAPVDLSPARAAARVQTPLLLIHGEADRTIPMHHHERVREALSAHPSVQSWVVAGADHGYTYSAATATYEERVLEFLARHLQ